MRRAVGFSLTELLIVVAIVALLAGLLFPVFARAKASSKQSACASNLKQASMALNLYIEDNGDYPMMLLDGKLIRATSPITSYASMPTKIFVCPLDRPEGRGAMPLTDRREPRSFYETWFLWEGKGGVSAWKELGQLEPNPIIFRCYFHDERIRTLLQGKEISSFGSQRNGLALVARRDGSVTLDRRRDVFWDQTKQKADDKKAMWTQATEQPCPAEICDGRPPEEGIREY